MAAMITTWEQAAMFDPSNPNQRTHVRYTGIPGGYSSFYYNQVPTTAKLQGALGSLSMPDWITAGVVGVLGLAVGFLGARTLGLRLRRARR